MHHWLVPLKKRSKGDSPTLLMQISRMMSLEIRRKLSWFTFLHNMLSNECTLNNSVQSPTVRPTRSWNPLTKIPTFARADIFKYSFFQVLWVSGMPSGYNYFPRISVRIWKIISLLYLDDSCKRFLWSWCEGCQWCAVCFERDSLALCNLYLLFLHTVPIKCVYTSFAFSFFGVWV